MYHLFLFKSKLFYKFKRLKNFSLWLLSIFMALRWDECHHTLKWWFTHRSTLQLLQTTRPLNSSTLWEVWHQHGFEWNVFITLMNTCGALVYPCCEQLEDYTFANGYCIFFIIFSTLAVLICLFYWCFAAGTVSKNLCQLCWIWKEMVMHDISVTHGTYRLRSHGFVSRECFLALKHLC